MAKHILAIWNKEVPNLPIPRGWELHKAETYSEGMIKVKELAPSVLMLSESQDGHSGFDFLKDVEINIGAIPPSIIWGFLPGNMPTDEEIDLFGVLSAMEGPPKFKDIIKILEPFFVEPPLPPMTIPEFLSAVVCDQRSGVYEFKTGGSTDFRVIVKEGQLLASLDESFRRNYRDFLSQGGIDLPEMLDDITADILEIDSIPFLDQKKMAEVKNMAFALSFENMQLNQETRFLKNHAQTYKGAFIPVDIFPVLRKILDKLPLEGLEPLKYCSFKKNELNIKKITNVGLMPDEGFILHTLDSFLTYGEIKKTIVSVSESQLIRKLYLLFILGLLESSPKGGVPQRILYLKQEIESDNKLINSQSIAIEQFAENLSIPGLSPYRVLGLKENTGLQDALESFKNLENLFHIEKLHPVVRKKYVQHLTIIHGKLAEALLLLEASYLDGKQKAKEKQGEDLKFVARIGEAKTDVQKVTDNRQKEAEKLYAQAKEFQENNLPYEAGQYLKTALVYNPFSAPVHHLLAQVYLATGGARSKHMAERELRMAIDNDPWNVRFLLDLSKLYIEENMPNRARALLDQAQRIDPKSIEVRDMKELARKVELKRK
jgi:hypothetical protein